MQIKAAIDKIPAGLMLVPLFIGSLIRTLFPEAFESQTFTHSFTGGLLTGTTALLGGFYLCLGSTIRFNATGYVLKKGGALWFGKIGTTFAIALLIKSIFPDQNNLFLGLSALAIVAAFSDTNGAIYMALMGQLGKKKEDIAAYSIMSIESGPFFTMLILGIAGLASFPISAFVFTLLPLLVGMILGNLDEKMRDFLSKGEDVFIPLLGLAIGAGINLTNVVKAGLSGIFLGIAVVIITGVALFILDRITGGDGVGGLAASNTAGNAAAVPLSLAAVNPIYNEVAVSATLQVSAAVIVTAILSPVLTVWYAKRVEKRKVQNVGNIGM
ncbi:MULTISPECIES: 2-keto-3-deoxygluconate permease [Bacillus]|uniref:2-keto-3-deoxygluconate permease n=1 Tax=Bacillus TaxID=1386 RepID=UPI00165A1BCC|nr:2-keto-3-deoxygluconate permease [Bacillus subtilis]MCY7781309.1 2-keto-3-deoxygluconate permease [Bacillus sp. S20C3]MCY8202201.1 2-keto-3-deoxygluconate permease [Bacillus sp. N12A5]MCY8290565.1 2-keto-3-deoxygluconate permease [Bacillus sp. N13C7]MCY8640128.1 2-keto-3-deoxygluconate permease [Bacillus sp. S17B2]MCY8721558.1 2-keto-3-deoxygluconate permease [Bacillus sp. S10C12M]MCY9144362.1 2-keto-3-deoxygluconate permease [Bacillus sp. T9C1]